MADCGATGSALDRAASAIIGGGSAHGDAGAAAAAAAGRAVASLVTKTVATAPGTTTTANGGGGQMLSATLLPSAPPDRLFLPGAGAGAAVVQVPPPQHLSQAQQQTMAEAWDGPASTATPNMRMHHPPPPHIGPMMRSSTGMPHHSPAAALAHQQRMHMHQMAAQQQMQQHMMMMRQQQLAIQQHQHHQQQQSTIQQQQQQQSSLTNNKQKGNARMRTREKTNNIDASRLESTTALEDAAESWHNGLESEMLQNLESYRTDQDDVKTVNDEEYDQEEVLDDNEEADVLGHEGYVEGASIDQLAAAWAKAEAEVQAEYSDYTSSLAEGEAEAAVDMAATYAALNSALEHEWEEGEAEKMHPYDFGESSAPHPEESVLRDTDFMSEGMRHFEAGNISEAIRAFETEVRHVDPDNSDAWRMLGRCHAENDEDRKAIACLERAVDRDPYSVEALLALGTSYVNELDHLRALRSLKAWVTHNAMYAGMDLPEVSQTEDAVSSTGERERQALEEVKKLLRRAIDVDPSQTADAMEALGVVCNVSREYDKAIDLFKQAIETRPDNYQLWNKLGATLANSNRSEEALPAYHKALRLKPRYARAWLNMAISHANLHNYDEAARCYLQTLSLNPSASHVWSYLRIALTCSERWDLLPLSASQNLAAFKEHYDFELYE